MGLEDSHEAEALQRYRNKGQVKKYFGTFGFAAGQTNLPRGICSTASNDIVVADTLNGRVQIFDDNGQVKRVIEVSCEDVCVTPKGLIVVSDDEHDLIRIFDEQAECVSEFGNGGSGDGKLNAPCGVATDHKGKIYVCDGRNHQVQVFSEGGQFERKFGSDHLENPAYLSVTSNGRVVVSDYDNNNIHVFDTDGGHLFQFGTEGTKESQFKYPQGIATDDHGNIVVADSGNNRVQVFTSDGEFVTCFGTECSGPVQKIEPFGGNAAEPIPVGVCLLSDGRIVVTDFGCNIVLIF